MDTYQGELMNNRRKLVIALGASAFAAPFGSYAQGRAGKNPRVGVLTTEPISALEIQFGIVRAGLSALGYTEGKNIGFEFRSAEGNYARLPELAAGLVRLDVDIIVTIGTPPSLAAKAATSTIPIVMAGVGDPVGTSLVASLAHPGGNLTGTSNLSPPLMVKRLAPLKEARPAMKRVAVLLNPSNPVQQLSFDAMEPAAKSVKIELQKFEARNAAEIQSAFSAMAKKPADAIVITNDSMLIANSGMIAGLAAKQRMLSSGDSEFAQAGGLIGYGSTIDVYRSTATYIDKILKGARPADLPVEQPSKFAMVVNLKAAKALGIKIPNSILVRADKVIE